MQFLGNGCVAYYHSKVVNDYLKKIEKGTENEKKTVYFGIYFI